MPVSLRALQGGSFPLFEQLFIDDGQFIVPEGVTRAFVEVVSAAGGGRYGGAYAAAGGGGALAAGWVDLIPGQVIPIIVGKPGASVRVVDADTSSPGGSSSFGNLLSATGGGGTTRSDLNSYFYPAEGGKAYGGQIRIDGAPGALAYIHRWTTRITHNGGIIEGSGDGRYVMTAPGTLGPAPGAFEWPGMEPVIGTGSKLPPFGWLKNPPLADMTLRTNLPKVSAGLPTVTGDKLYNSNIGGASGIAVGVYQINDRVELIMPSTQGYVRVRF